MKPVKVMFVCLGNICRSPTAHGVFQHFVDKAGLQRSVIVESSGTGSWHIGHPPDPRAARAAADRGYDLSALRAQQVSEEDFLRFDYILAMDRANLTDLQAMQPAAGGSRLSLFLSYAEGLAEDEVPDPYYGGEAGFERVLDMVENASRGLLRHIKETHLKSLSD